MQAKFLKNNSKINEDSLSENFSEDKKRAVELFIENQKLKTEIINWENKFNNLNKIIQEKNEKIDLQETNINELRICLQKKEIIISNEKTQKIELKGDFIELEIKYKQVVKKNQEFRELEIKYQQEVKKNQEFRELEIKYQQEVKKNQEYIQADNLQNLNFENNDSENDSNNFDDKKKIFPIL